MRSSHYAVIHRFVSFRRELHLLISVQFLYNRPQIVLGEGLNLEKWSAGKEV